MQQLESVGSRTKKKKNTKAAKRTLLFTNPYHKELHNLNLSTAATSNTKTTFVVHLRRVNVCH